MTLFKDYRVEKILDFENYKIIDKSIAGMFANLNKAKSIVEHDRTHLNETVYDYAVIEKVPLYLYNYLDSNVVAFFRYDYDKDVYKETNVPHEIKEIHCYWFYEDFDLSPWNKIRFKCRFWLWSLLEWLKR